MYTVECKNCGNFYESKVNRSGICPDCKINNRGRNNTRYRDRTYDRLTLYVPKGNREELKEYVSAQGMSMNEFINNAIDLYIEKLETEKAENEKKKAKETVRERYETPPELKDFTPLDEEALKEFEKIFEGEDVPF